MEQIPKKLKDKWEKILVNEGLGDIEYSNGQLKVAHNTRITEAHVTRPSYTHLSKKTSIALNILRTETTAEYYYQAGHFLTSYLYFKRRERIIWEYNVEGKSMREIVSLLKKRRIKTSKSVVHRTIQALSEVMLSDNWDRRPGTLPAE